MRNISTPMIGRRVALSGLVATATTVLVSSRISVAQNAAAATPRQTEGPFYPVSWTGDIDNDLVVVQGEAAKALGQIAHIEGRVMDVVGNPIAGAKIEIWQCDANGVYRHPRDERGGRRRDGGFQGRGRTVSDDKGRYSFRTIKPVTYPGRTPHIHFRVDPVRGAALITQLYVFGEKQNERDGVLNGIRDTRQRDSVIVKFDAAAGLEAGAVAARFDLVIG